MVSYQLFRYRKQFTLRLYAGIFGGEGRLVHAGMAGGLRASGPKADIALIVCETGAASAGVFTQNLMCAAPVTFCKEILSKGSTAKAVLLASTITLS